MLVTTQQVTQRPFRTPFGCGEVAAGNIVRVFVFTFSRMLCHDTQSYQRWPGGTPVIHSEMRREVPGVVPGGSSSGGKNATSAISGEADSSTRQSVTTNTTMWSLRCPWRDE